MTEKILTLIVDDEPLAQDISEHFIGLMPDMIVAGKCRNALEAFTAISKGNIDLILLDINMPEISGLDFLKNLKDPPMVIFTTAYSEHAIESYELNAVDYLLKPFSFERFSKAIAKVRQLMASKKNDSSAKAPDNAVIDNLMFVKTEGKLVRIDLSQLWFVEGLKDYLRLWTSSGKIVIHSTMKNFEESLAAYPNFIRVHKSYIANVQYISEVDGNALHIKGQSIGIGNTYKEDVFKLLNNYKLL